MATERAPAQLKRIPVTSSAQLRLSDQVANELRGRIYAGIYRPGHRLIEADLAREFGVSRAPLREAVVTLKREGLVRVTPYRGAVVARLDENDMLEIQLLRTALEGLAVRRVATDCDSEVAAALRARLEQMAEAVRREDAVALTEAHIGFHREIAAGSRLPRLIEILDHLARQSHALRSYASLAREAFPRVIEDHEQLLDAITSADPDVAHAAIVLHINARHEPIATLLEAAKAASETD